VDTAQAGKRGKFSRWLARYKRRMDFKMLAIGDGEQPVLWLMTNTYMDCAPKNVWSCLQGSRTSGVWPEVW
jgi:hypothetical protein